MAVMCYLYDVVVVAATIIIIIIISLSILCEFLTPFKWIKNENSSTRIPPFMQVKDCQRFTLGQFNLKAADTSIRMFIKFFSVHHCRRPTMRIQKNGNQEKIKWQITLNICVHLNGIFNATLSQWPRHIRLHNSIWLTIFHSTSIRTHTHTHTRTHINAIRPYIQVFSSHFVDWIVWPLVWCCSKICVNHRRHHTHARARLIYAYNDPFESNESSLNYIFEIENQLQYSYDCLRMYANKIELDLKINCLLFSKHIFSRGVVDSKDDEKTRTDRKCPKITYLPFAMFSIDWSMLVFIECLFAFIIFIQFVRINKMYE